MSLKNTQLTKELKTVIAITRTS